MRTGTVPGEVFDGLLARGKIVIHGSDVERTRRLAAEASVGKLVVADTREQVGRINAFAHRIRKATGEVDEQVLTAAGERLGVGDTIATRRNDRDVDVANREIWNVLSCDRGALTVRGEAGTRVLPSDYVRRDVESPTPRPPTARKAPLSPRVMCWSANTAGPRRRTSG